MTNPDGFPVDPSQAPVVPASSLDPSLNPFAGNQPVEQQPSRLGLGGNILSQAGVLIPDAPELSRPDGEVVRNAEQAAKKACGQIAEMFIKGTDPDSIVFPQCDDMGVVNLALQQIGNTPLGLGFGKFPDSVPKAWARFLSETTANYRQANGLEPADLVPVEIHLPDWLEQNPSFDILERCELMDITIASPVRSVVATGVKYCRIRFKGAVLNVATVGTEASRSTFVFDSTLSSSRSFQNASNISVEIKGQQQGTIGPMSASIASCSGNFNGWYEMKEGTGCKIGSGINLRDNTRAV